MPLQAGVIRACQTDGWGTVWLRLGWDRTEAVGHLVLMQNVPLQAQIAPRLVFQIARDPLMHRRQRVPWNRRPCVMFGVVVHIPEPPLHEGRGIYRSRPRDDGAAVWQSFMFRGQPDRLEHVTRHQ